jgi:NADH-quinone oxidoreductase subunit N
VLRNIFLRDPEGSKEPLLFSKPQITLLVLLMIPTIVFGLYFTPIVDFANASLMMFGIR